MPGRGEGGCGCQGDAKGAAAAGERAGYFSETFVVGTGTL